MNEERRAAESVAGCWITAGWDMNWYDVRPHACEIDALRYAARNPDSCQVYLVPWGKALDFDHRLSRQPEHSDGEERKMWDARTAWAKRDAERNDGPGVEQ